MQKFNGGRGLLICEACRASIAYGWRMLKIEYVNQEAAERHTVKYSKAGRLLDYCSERCVDRAYNKPKLHLAVS